MEWNTVLIQLALFNTLKPRQNGCHFADDTFKCIFLNENVWIPITICLAFVPKGPINNIQALVQKMAWHWPGDKPLSESMMVSLPTHICVTRPQWVKWLYKWGHVFVLDVVQNKWAECRLNKYTRPHDRVSVLWWMWHGQPEICICIYVIPQYWSVRHCWYSFWSKAMKSPFCIVHITGLVQERCNSIANALELRLSCRNPYI